MLRFYDSRKKEKEKKKEKKKKKREKGKGAARQHTALAIRQLGSQLRHLHGFSTKEVSKEEATRQGTSPQESCPEEDKAA